MRNSWFCKHTGTRWGTSVTASAYDCSPVTKEVVNRAAQAAWDVARFSKVCVFSS